MTTPRKAAVAAIALAAAILALPAAAITASGSRSVHTAGTINGDGDIGGYRTEDQKFED